MFYIGLHGIFASFICSTIFHPVDTIKVRLQGNKPIFNKSLYNGIKLRYVTSTVQSGTFWTVYEEIKKTKSTAEASAYASFIAALAETPFDIIKRRSQLCNRALSWKLMAQYTGLNTISSINQMTSYLTFCDNMNPAAAGFITSLISYPLDTLKTMTLSQKIPKLQQLTYGYLFKIIYITGYLNLNTHIMNFTK
tara:strand:+ start:3962 stop:4543 length:582 start_codon:yes stop_codon:yes gene_type:complete